MNPDWSQAQSDIGDEIADRESHRALVLLITGNPVDGFRYRGPFEGGGAEVWAEAHDHEADWWVAPLNPPHDEDDNDHHARPDAPVLVWLAGFAKKFAPTEWKGEEWDGSGADHAAWLYEQLEAFGFNPIDYSPPF